MISMGFGIRNAKFTPVLHHLKKGNGVRYDKSSQRLVMELKKQCVLGRCILLFVFVGSKVEVMTKICYTDSKQMFDREK